MENFVNGHKYQTLFKHITTGDMRHIRSIYKVVRTSDIQDPNIFFPLVGCTLGEFCVAVLLKKKLL